MSTAPVERPIRRLGVFDVLVGAFIASWVVFAGLPSASAHDTSTFVPIGQNYIYNYDYRNQSTAYDNRDWPVNIIFWNGASVQQVKDNRQDIYEYNCNVFNFCNMEHRSFQRNSINGSGWKWDTDGGRKEFRCGYSGGADIWSLHWRAYENTGLHPGGTADQSPLWDPGWGYFVPVSSHYDIDDPDNLPFSDCDNKAHGYDETAEGWVVSHYNALPGWSGTNDWTVHFHSQPPALRVLGGINHYGNGNGNTSIVSVPAFQ